MQKSEYTQWLFTCSKSTMKTRTRCVICSKLTKETPEPPHWYEDIKKHWHHSGLSTVNFEKIPCFFLVFHSWILGSIAGWVYQQRSKYRQVKIMKHARTDANYAILTKQVEQQHEKKPVSNLLSKHLWNLLRFFFLQE